MKKTIITIVAIPILALILFGVIYQLRSSSVNNKAETELNLFLEEWKIPKEEVIDITKTDQKFLSESFLSWDFSVVKNITTQKDYESWKTIVQQEGKLLNGENLPNKNYLEDSKNCEIVYNLSISSKDTSSKEVTLHFNWGGNSTSDEEFIKEHFAYFPPADIYEKWKASQPKK
ncbi:hypothetical protein SAMN02745116_00681 [Pilibacter termitis]|uniref:Uncharacterized protein n=1 Tax=Pilibacter termitis TaxID=263852 RepID=A0A1T4LJB7_9ENTE|nr:hypothetical protein [Pilibacter termitis]SJZ54716.1 hypothetical protein SAMN02745116_00681 [Pilibacter termitis]